MAPNAAELLKRITEQGLDLVKEGPSPVAPITDINQALTDAGLTIPRDNRVGQGVRGSTPHVKGLTSIPSHAGKTILKPSPGEQYYQDYLKAYPELFPKSVVNPEKQLLEDIKNFGSLSPEDKERVLHEADKIRPISPAHLSTAIQQFFAGEAYNPASFGKHGRMRDLWLESSPKVKDPTTGAMVENPKFNPNINPYGDWSGLGMNTPVYGIKSSDMEKYVRQRLSDQAAGRSGIKYGVLNKETGQVTPGFVEDPSTNLRDQINSRNIPITDSAGNQVYNSDGTPAIRQWIDGYDNQATARQLLESYELSQQRPNKNAQVKRAFLNKQLPEIIKSRKNSSTDNYEAKQEVLSALSTDVIAGLNAETANLAAQNNREKLVNDLLLGKYQAQQGLAGIEAQIAGNESTNRSRERVNQATIDANERIEERRIRKAGEDNPFSYLLDMLFPK